MVFADISFLIGMMMMVVFCCMAMGWTLWRNRSIDRKLAALDLARYDMKRGFEEARLLIAYGATDEGIQMLIETSARGTVALRDSQV